MAFKKVIEDETESFVLVDGQLVPKSKAKNAKLADAVTESLPSTAPEHLVTESEVETAPTPDDGTALGKLKARKADTAKKAAIAKKRKRVQEITKTKAKETTKVNSYDELMTLVEEAAEMYPNCDFSVSTRTINYTENKARKSQDRYQIAVTLGDRTRTTSIAADDVTFENVISFLDEASN